MAGGGRAIDIAYKTSGSAVNANVYDNRAATGLVGDVDGAAAAGHLAALTPVPGGVGPMTIAMLMQNTLTLAEKARLK